MKSGKRSAKWFCLAILSISMLTGAAYADDLLIRAEINSGDGSQVKISAPLCLLELLKTSIPRPVGIDREEISPLVDSFIEDFETMKGQDLVRVEGKENVHVWVDEIESPEDANFIKIDVDEGDDAPEVHLRIPKGLLFLVSHIGNKFVEMHGEHMFPMMKRHMPHPPAPCPPEKIMKKKREHPEHPAKKQAEEMKRNYGKSDS